MSDIPRRAALTTFAAVFASAIVAPRLRLEALELPAAGGGPGDEAFWGRAPEIHGVRVTPNVYTSRAELDGFVGAVERVVEHGL